MTIANLLRLVALAVLYLVARDIAAGIVGEHHALALLLALAATGALAGFVLLAAPENLLKQAVYQLSGPTASSRLLLRDTTVKGVVGSDLLFASSFVAVLTVLGMRLAAAAISTGQPTAFTGFELPWFGLAAGAEKSIIVAELLVACLAFAVAGLLRHQRGRDRLAGEINQANWYPVYLAVTIPAFLAIRQIWVWMQPLFSEGALLMMHSGPAIVGTLLLGITAANEVGRRVAGSAFQAGTSNLDSGSVILPRPRREANWSAQPVDTMRPPSESKPEPRNEQPIPAAAPTINKPAPQPAVVTQNSTVVVPSRQSPRPEAEVPPIVFKPLATAQTVIRGQAGPIREIEETLKLACAGLSNRDDKPLASFLFLGPTGVGKTETAKAIAEVLYGDRNRIARFNMNEASGEGGQWRAFGPPPGYMGSDKGGQLTRQIIQFGGRCVVLLDEMEKGPREVFDALLTGLDEGYVEDASLHQRISLKDAVVIMTSNLLATEETAADEEELRARVRDAEVADSRLGRIRPFRPEFVGRIKTVVQFNPLGREHLTEILRDRYRKHFAPRILQAKGAAVPELTPGAVDYLMAGMGEAAFGARQLDREIEKRLMLGLIDLDATHIPDPAVWHYDAPRQQLMLLSIEQAAVILGGADQAARENSLADLQRHAEALRRQAASVVRG